MRDTGNMSYYVRGASPLRSKSRSRSPPARMHGINGGQGIDPYRPEGGHNERVVVHRPPPVLGPSPHAAVEMAHNATRAANETRHTLTLARAEITDLKENLAAAESALGRTMHEREALARENSN